MTQPIYLVDAFAGRPFEGNPAGVVPLPEGDWPAEDWMRSVAMEMNQAETAFVLPGPEPGLRWFTPATEVDLCGHATLAAAHVLWTERGVRGDVAFRTRSGTLTCQIHNDGVLMDFPATPPEASPADGELLAALGVAEAAYFGRTRFDAFVVVDSPEVVAGLSPDLRGVASRTERGVIVTAAGGAGCDFVSRFFAPACGVDEDPVTGSAHCALAPYWAGVLGRASLTGRQLSRRGGEVCVTAEGDRVELCGSAVTTVRGELLAGA